MDQQARADHGEYHQAQRQFQDGRLVAEQALFGNAPAIQEQQRRQEQQEEQLRFQFMPGIEHTETTAPSAIWTNGKGNENGRMRIR